MSILGLVSGKTFTDNSFHNRNNRRRIFHDYPVGQFPLTGLLSLMDTEETDSFEFGWWEKRYEMLSTTVKSGAAPFQASDGQAAGSPLAVVAGTEYRLLVVSTAEFQARQVIMVPELYVSSGVFTAVKAIVTEVIDSTTLKIQAIEASAGFVNTNTASPTGPTGCYVMVIGNANAEGSSSTTGRLILPVNAKNYTQIFRNAFSFTRTALKVPTEFDKTGIYREKAEDNLRQHMVDMELAFLFGAKRTENVTENGETTPRRFTGGVEWYLQQWEKADSVYRGGAGAPAVTLTADDNKRIIPAAGGSMTWKLWNGYLERAFRTTNDKAFEKIILCGSGMLAAVNAILETKATLNKDFAMQKVYGMNVVTWETAFGTVHFKTHPLFSKSPFLRYNGLLLDVQNLKFRALNDSDTTLLKNRQANDYDGRKDEWMTEAGLEVNLPESCMYFKNVQEITAS